MERGIIAQIVDDYHVTVRIPSLNKSSLAFGGTPDKELYTAVISASPGICPKLHRGDSVLIDFESDNVSKPVVVGLLFNALNKKSQANELKVETTAELPRDTTIGKVKPRNIAKLEGLEENVQNKFKAIDTTLDEHEADITEVESELKKKADKKSVYTKKEVQAMFNPIVLGKDSYGKTLPATGEKGQLFLLLEQNSKSDNQDHSQEREG